MINYRHGICIIYLALELTYLRKIQEKIWQIMSFTLISKKIYLENLGRFKKLTMVNRFNLHFCKYLMCNGNYEWD